MKIIVIRNFDGIPRGSRLQQVTQLGKYFRGLYCSREGSYFVKIPMTYCIVEEKPCITFFHEEETWCCQGNNTFGYGESPLKAFLSWENGFNQRFIF